MESVNLKLKFMDALKMVMISSWLPFGLGIGLAAYQGNINSENIPFFLLLLIGLTVIVTLIAMFIPYLTLTEDGLNFKNSRGRNVFCSWNDEVLIESDKYGAIPVYSFKHEELNKTYKIPKVLFSYDEGKSFIRNHAPADHQLRNIVS